MIDTRQVTVIDGDNLLAWLQTVLKPYFSDEVMIHLTHHEWECHGESQFFCAIDVDIYGPQTIEDLLKKQISTDLVDPDSDHKYFYVDDVVNVAEAMGLLKGTFFHLHYKW